MSFFVLRWIRRHLSALFENDCRSPCTSMVFSSPLRFRSIVYSIRSRRRRYKWVFVARQSCRSDRQTLVPTLVLRNDSRQRSIAPPLSRRREEFLRMKTIDGTRILRLLSAVWSCSIDRRSDQTTQIGTQTDFIDRQRTSAQAGKRFTDIESVVYE